MENVLLERLKKIWAGHKGENLQLHIKGDTFGEHTMTSIFNVLVRESYYEGKHHNFLTLATKEARYSILKYGIIYKSQEAQS
jgi:hypothetical protein